MKASFYITENTLNFSTTGSFRMKIFRETGLLIHGNFSPTTNHLHPLQVENCDSNSRLVVDEDDNINYSIAVFHPLEVVSR